MPDRSAGSRDAVSFGPFRLLPGERLLLRDAVPVELGGRGVDILVAVGRKLMEDFSGAVVFVDFGLLNDPGLVATATSSMVGLGVHSDDPAAALIAHMRDKRVLLILDTCEHVLDAAAALTSRIFEGA